MSLSVPARPVVELIRASKSYQNGGDVVYALRDVDLELAAGSFTAVVGRSGCGKSTLLNLAGAVDLPTSGDVRIGQASTREMDDDELSRLRRTRIGFVFQFFNLLPTLTVRENVELPLLLDRKPMPADGQPGSRDAVSASLEMVGLMEKQARFPHQLSGGEMQRAAIARALAHQPSVIIADEPTGNLDTVNAESVLRILQRAANEFGTTVLMATHSKEASGFASRVLSMRDGQLLPA
jgi:putative ABC transport system ATP-binding protein